MNSIGKCLLLTWNYLDTGDTLTNKIVKKKKKKPS